MNYFSPNHGANADIYFSGFDAPTEQDGNHQLLLERAAHLIAAALLAGWDQYKEPVMKAINSAPWMNMAHPIDLICDSEDSEGAFDDFCAALPFDNEYENNTEKAWEIFHDGYMTYFTEEIE